MKYRCYILLVFTFFLAMIAIASPQEAQGDDLGFFYLSEDELTLNVDDDSEYNPQYCLRNDSFILTVCSRGNEMVNAVSNDTSIVRLERVDGNSGGGVTYPYWKIVPVKSGTTNIDCYDDYGHKDTLKVIVNFNIRPMKLNDTNLQFDCKDDDAPVKTIGYDSRSDIFFKNSPRITKVTSMNDKVVRLEKKEEDGVYGRKNYSWNVIPVKSGTTNLKCEDDFGQSILVNVKVNWSFTPFKLNTDSLTIDSAGHGIGYGLAGNTSYCDIERVSGPTIKSVQSQNENIVKVIPVKEKYEWLYWKLIAVKAGTTTIKCDDGFGKSAYVKVTVDDHPLELNTNRLTINSYNPEGEDVTIGDSFYDNIYPNESKIVRVKVRNSRIVSVTAYDHDDEETDSSTLWKIIPKAPGETFIECFDDRGYMVAVKVIVTKKYIRDYIASKSSIRKIRYGDKRVYGRTTPNSKVTIKIAGKKYKTKSNTKGRFVKKIPLRRIGTRITATTKYKGVNYSFSKRIVKSPTKSKVFTVYRFSRNIKVKLSKVNKGDTIRLNVGGRTYKRKLKTGKKIYNIRIKGNLKAGSKIRLTVKNKFKQPLSKLKSKVYYAPSIKKGMTKKQCKLVPGWGNPVHISVDNNTTIWWYEDASLTFYKGKLEGWSYQV